MSGRLPCFAIALVLACSATAADAAGQRPTKSKSSQAEAKPLLDAAPGMDAADPLTLMELRNSIPISTQNGSDRTASATVAPARTG